MLTSEENGFTLIELLVTVTISSILLSIAIPSYKTFVLNSRTTAQSNEFFSALNFARSEAVKRNDRVTICKSNNQTTCAVDSLSVLSASWQPGWIVFVDTGVAGIIDGADTILRVHGPFDASTTFVGNANITNYVSFIASGRTQLANGGLQGGTFSLCSSDKALSRRKIVITQASSRVRVDKVNPAATCAE
jgi:type IV fimbrial biogenesis protein FimT